MRRWSRSEAHVAAGSNLRRAEAYFSRLHDDLRDKAADTTKDGYSVCSAEMVLEAIQRLRFEPDGEQ